MAVYLGSNQVDMLGGDGIPSAYLIPSGTYSISQNGTYDVGSYKSVGVSVFDTEDEIIARTISVYENSRISLIGPYAFRDCSNLTSINFPNCTYIGSYAFVNCFNLISVNFPKCTSIGYYAFMSCDKLIQISFPNCTSIDYGVFNYCSGLISVDFPSCISIGEFKNIINRFTIG